MRAGILDALHLSGVRYPGPLRRASGGIHATPGSKGMKLIARRHEFAFPRRPLVMGIINLVEEKVEVYTRPKGGKNPRYQERRDYAKDESVPLVIDGTQVGAIPVKELLP